TFDVVQYTDGLGRKLATVEEGNGNFIVKDAVLFNARAAARDTFQPFAAATNAYDPQSFTAAFATQRYDATGRAVQKLNPPERADCRAPGRSRMTTQSLPLVKTILDENGNEKVSVTDGLTPLDEKMERVIERQEVNQGERYYSFYAYNAVDSLTSATDAQNNVKTFGYDGLQRKTSVNDTDRGTVAYTYDAASNLSETADAKGQHIRYTYDGANRLRGEDYVDEGLPFSAQRSADVEYHYDEPFGTVDPGDGTPPRTAQNTRGTLAWVRDLSGEEHVSHDARGRVQYVIKRICDPQLQTGRYCGLDHDVAVSYKTEMQYDAMDRVTDLIYPDNDAVSYHYNARSLLRNISGGPSGSVIQNIDY